MVFGESVWGFECSLSKISENLICSRSEMDITFVFGTKISGSNPDGSTTLNPFILGRCSDFDNRYIFYFSRSPLEPPNAKFFSVGVRFLIANFNDFF